MRPAVSHKNGTFQAGRTCRIRARGHRKIKAVFPHPGGFSAYMFLHCRAGRNLHSNYTLKLAKCKETYAFFSTFTQKLYFIFMISHKNHRRNSAKAAARSAPELTSAGAETLFHNLFPFAQPIVENTSGETGAPFSTVWKVHCRPVRCGFPQSCAVGFPLCGVFRYGGECVPDRKTGGASG